MVLLAEAKQGWPVYRMVILEFEITMELVPQLLWWDMLPHIIVEL